jgi:hypothetical protein
MPFPFMTQRSLKSLLATALLILPSLLAAQQVAASEEERLAAIMADPSRWYVPKNTVTIGFRMLSAGGNVQYGNLGSVPGNATVAPASDGAVARNYSNGYVDLDGLRADEKNADGSQSSTAGGRYAIFSTRTNEDGTTRQVQTANYLSYTPGVTRYWAYASADQVTANGRIAMSNYSAASDGGSALKDTGPTGGVEFTLNRAFGQISKRTEWGVIAGVSLNNLNNKTSGSVLSTLKVATDYYSLNGLTALAAPYSADSYADYVTTEGDTVTSGLETTVPIGTVPVQSTTSAVVGGTTVNGNWQVKGAYMLVRVGPSLRAQLTSRLGLSASIGLAGAYAGSTYTAYESFVLPTDDATVVSTNDLVEQNKTAKFLSGYYADFNLEWAATERTGLFGGLTAQQLGDYDQTLNGRTARIDLGNSVGIRGGVSIRF